MNKEVAPRRFRNRALAALFPSLHDAAYTCLVAESSRIFPVAFVYCYAQASFMRSQWWAVTKSGGPLDNQTWQTEWKTAHCTISDNVPQHHLNIYNLIGNKDFGLNSQILSKEYNIMISNFIQGRVQDIDSDKISHPFNSKFPELKWILHRKDFRLL